MGDLYPNFNFFGDYQEESTVINHGIERIHVVTQGNTKRAQMRNKSGDANQILNGYVMSQTFNPGRTNS
jgi:hypothetical protein